MFFSSVLLLLISVYGIKTIKLFKESEAWKYTAVFRFEKISYYLISEGSIDDEVKECYDAKIFRVDPSKLGEYKNIIDKIKCLSFIKKVNNKLFLLTDEKKSLLILDLNTNSWKNHSAAHPVLQILINEEFPQYFVLKKRVSFVEDYIMVVCKKYGEICRDIVGNYHFLRWYNKAKTFLFFVDRVWNLQRLFPDEIFIEPTLIKTGHHTSLYICKSNILATVFQPDTGEETVYFIDSNMTAHDFKFKNKYPMKSVRLTDCDNERFLIIIRDFEVHLAVGYFSSRKIEYLENSIGYYFSETLKCPGIWFDINMKSIIHAYTSSEYFFNAEYFPYFSMSNGRNFSQVKIEPGYTYNTGCLKQNNCVLFLTRDCSDRIPFFVSDKSPWLRLSTGRAIYTKAKEHHPIMLFLSRDYGQTWSATLPGTYIVTTGFQNSSIIAVAANGSRYYITFDEGVTWESTNINLAGDVKSVAFRESDKMLEIYLQNKDAYTLHFIPVSPKVNECKPSQMYLWSVPNMESKTDCINGAKSFFFRRNESCILAKNYNNSEIIQPCECKNNDLLCNNDFTWKKNVCYGYTNRTQQCLENPWNDKPSLVKRYPYNQCKQTKNNILTLKLADDFELCKKYENFNIEEGYRVKIAEQWIIVKLKDGFNIYPVSSTDYDFISYVNIKFDPDFTTNHVLIAFTVDMNSKCVFAAADFYNIYRGCFTRDNTKNVKFTIFYTFNMDMFIADIKMDVRHENFLILVGMDIYVLKNSFRAPAKLITLPDSVVHDNLETGYIDKIDKIAFIATLPNNNTKLMVYDAKNKSNYLLKNGENEIKLVGQTAVLFKRGTDRYYTFNIDTQKYGEDKHVMDKKYDSIHVVKAGKDYLSLGILNGTIYNFRKKIYLSINSYLLGIETYKGEERIERCDLLSYCFAYKDIMMHSCPILMDNTQHGCTCDKKNNCQDLYCKNGFMCKNYACITYDEVCDGKFDCDDLSDEALCPACKPEEILCQKSDKCIKKSQVCDLVVDCPEQEDEKNCNKDPCPVNTTYCDNGSCVNSTKFCQDPITSDCYTCVSTEYCIPYKSICDGKFDCPAFDDETGCREECDFTCLMGGCVKKYEVCDNRSSCVHGDDEWRCKSDKEKDVNHSLVIGINVLIAIALLLIISSIIYCFVDAYLIYKRNNVTVNENNNYTEISLAPLEFGGFGYENEDEVNENAGIVYVMSDDEEEEDTFYNIYRT